MYGASVRAPKAYKVLIEDAICSAEGQRATLDDIYQHIIHSDRQLWTQTKSPSSWQNSVRHTLSMSPRFVKVPRDPSDPRKIGVRGKGAFYALNDSNHAPPSKRRQHQPQQKAKRPGGLKLEVGGAEVAVVRLRQPRSPRSARSPRLFPLAELVSPATASQAPPPHPPPKQRPSSELVDRLLNGLAGQKASQSGPIPPPFGRGLPIGAGGALEMPAAGFPYRLPSVPSMTLSSLIEGAEVFSSACLALSTDGSGYADGSEAPTAAGFPYRLPSVPLPSLLEGTEAVSPASRCIDDGAGVPGVAVAHATLPKARRRSSLEATKMGCQLPEFDITSALSDFEGLMVSPNRSLSTPLVDFASFLDSALLPAASEAA